MYSKIITHLFFLTLTCTVLSPYVGGSTLYLYVLIPFLDPGFYKFCLTALKPANVKSFIVFLAVIGAVSASFSFPARVVSIAIVVLYALYAYRAHRFYFYGYVILNVVWGMAQFTLAYVDPETAQLIGPTNIASVIWGPLAGPSWSNFYEVIALIRVSGLSRESGFFAAIIATTIAILIIDPRPTRKQKAWIGVFLAIGFVISLSKMSAASLLIFLVLYFGRKISRWSLALFFVCFLTIAYFAAQHGIYDSGAYLDDANNSVLHRTSGYVLPVELNLQDLLFGLDPIKAFDEYRTNPVMIMLNRSMQVFEVPGWGGIIIHYGLFAFIAAVAYMRLIGINTLYAMLITLLSIDISPIAVTASTVMAWFAIFLDQQKQMQAEALWRSSLPGEALASQVSIHDSEALTGPVAPE